jgi:alpha-tubulin suppressor-like RCC1 family protein
VIFWGSNQQNLLSSTSCKVYNRPQHLTTAYDIIDLSATEKSVAFITRDGSVYTYGINMDGRLGVGGNANTKTI